MAGRRRCNGARGGVAVRVTIVLCALVLPGASGCGSGGGGGGGSGGGGLSALPPSAPAIVDDDALWLCTNRPERPHDGALGLRIAGVRECTAGSTAAVAGGDIYVAPGGDDADTGDSPASALRTLAEALCRAQPGQTVHLAPGTYREGAALGALGSASSAPLVIRGEPQPGQPVVLDGERWRTHGIGLVECWNVRIEGIRFEHYSDAGVWVLLGGGIELVDLEVTGCGRCSVEPDVEGEGFGINLLGVQGYTVANCRFEDNGPLLSEVLAGRVLGTGINTFESSGGTIADNTITLTRGGGILIEDGSAVTVTGNAIVDNFLLAYDNYWDGGVWVDGSRDVTLRDNTIERNYGGAGVQISDEEGRYPTSSKEIRLTGNTIRDNLGAGVLIWGYGQCPPPADAVLDHASLTTDNTIVNNRLQGSAADLLCDPTFLGGELPD
ncbi:MAG: hypothetical protein D6776_05225 [Planctomycetota bacterium]|nr:MAG: hypothetical protein D6776_05225 [Planctomycetota bacterium]